MPIRILIADDHSVVRSGLTLLLQTQSDMAVVGQAIDGQDAYERVKEFRPDIILMDLSMSPGMDGIRATQLIKEEMPECKILILTMHDDAEYLLRVLQAKADGYILKDAPEIDLFAAIRAVFQGDNYLYPSGMKKIISKAMNQSNSEHTAEEPALTPREKEILVLISQGYTNKEIAEKLIVSVKTIETHKANLMEKLKLKTRHELVRYSAKKGWLSL